MKGARPDGHESGAVRRIATADPVAWRAFASPLYEVHPLPPAASFFGEAAMRRHGELLLCEAAHTPLRIDRDPHAYPADAGAVLLVEMLSRGTARGLAADTPTRADRRTVRIVDLSRRYRAVTGAVASYSALVPHGLVGYDPARHPAALDCSRHSQAGRLIALGLEVLVQASPRRGERVDPTVVAFLKVVRALVEAGPARQAAADETATVRAHIAAHLDEPALGVESVCAALGLSRSKLYRLLAGDGGVAAYIRDQRLERCFDALIQAPAGRGQVRRVAARWGFDDPGNFHRSFHARFGLSPSDCLDHAPAHTAGASGDLPRTGSVPREPCG